jgi:hypothetical protein
MLLVSIDPKPLAEFGPLKVLMLGSYLFVPSSPQIIDLHQFAV